MGILSLSFGDDPVWSIAEAIGAFIVCWILLSYLGVLLGLITEKPAEDVVEEYIDTDAEIDNSGI